MKKTVPFDLFGEEQYIYFDIPRLLDFEKAIGRSLAVDAFLLNPHLTLNETVIGLAIAMRHYDQKATASQYTEKISAYMEETGDGIVKISNLLLRAIVESGIYGKSVIDRMNGESIDKSENSRKNE